MKLKIAVAVGLNRTAGQIMTVADTFRARTRSLLPMAGLMALGLAISGGQVLRADVFCPNAASQGGFGGTYTNFAGSLDGTCGTNSGVTMSIPTNTDYGKLTWAGPSGITLGTLANLSAWVQFSAGQVGDGPYFQLAFVDPTGMIGQGGVGGSASDQILLIGYGDGGIPQDSSFHTTALDPNSTLLHLYDNTVGADLQGGIGGAMTLSNWLLGVLSADSGQQIDQVRLSVGLAGGCGGSCAETLAVDSAQITQTPEPGTFVLLGGAFAVLAAIRRRTAVSVH